GPQRRISAVGDRGLGRPRGARRLTAGRARAHADRRCPAYLRGILQFRRDEADWRARTAAMMDIQVKRVYDPPDPQDGYRVLVDRLWPRGLKKEQVQADVWLKEAAP